MLYLSLVVILVGKANLLSVQKLAVSVNHMKQNQTYAVKDNLIESFSPVELAEQTAKQIATSIAGRSSSTRQKNPPQFFMDEIAKKPAAKSTNKSDTKPRSKPKRKRSTKSKKSKTDDNDDDEEEEQEEDEDGDVSTQQESIESVITLEAENEEEKTYFLSTDILEQLTFVLCKKIQEHICKDNQPAMTLMPNGIEMLIMYTYQLLLHHLNNKTELETSYERLLDFKNDIQFQICFTKDHLIEKNETNLINDNDILGLYKSMSWIVHYYDNYYGKTTKISKKKAVVFDKTADYNELLDSYASIISEFIDFIENSKWSYNSLELKKKISTMLSELLALLLLLLLL